MAAFITNMTLFLLLMNLAGGIIAETGTFEVRRSNMTEEQCDDAQGSWSSRQGGFGMCTLSTSMDVQYQNNLDNVVRDGVCVNAEVEEDEEGNPLPVTCTPRNFQDQGISNGFIDTTFKTLGDISFGIGMVASIFSSAIVSPLGWITDSAFQCDVAGDGCTEQDVADSASWQRLIELFQIPIYLMYSLFILQLIINRRIL